MAKKRTTKKKATARKKAAVAKRAGREKRAGAGGGEPPEPKVRLLEEIDAGGGSGFGDPFDQRFRIEISEAAELEFFREWYGFTKSAAGGDKAWRQLD
ncbi:MAG: hypothetical protein ACR2RV_15605 [Verrucomicrobiales bacterium]